MADGSVTIKVDMDGSSAQSGVSKLKSLVVLKVQAQKLGLYLSQYSAPT